MSTIRTGPIPRSETYVQTRLITASSPQLPDNIKTRKEINLEIICSCLDNGGHYKKKPFKCPYHCITTCELENSPYCIALALTNAQKGNMKHGLEFAGSNVYRCQEIVSVKELMNTLVEEYEEAWQNAGRGDTA